MPVIAQVPDKVVVHPLVLLSVVDHYNRVAQNTKKRVAGILLGQNNGTTVNVANSYACISSFYYSMMVLGILIGHYLC